MRGRFPYTSSHSRSANRASCSRRSLRARHFHSNFNLAFFIVVRPNVFSRLQKHEARRFWLSGLRWDSGSTIDA